MNNIFWFRQDLRLSDNPGLYKAAENGYVIPIYIFDEGHEDFQRLGAASKWWLHHSLERLNGKLSGNLRVYKGKPIEIILRLVESIKPGAVYWNRCYEPWRIEADKEIKTILKERNITCASFQASVLWEPWKITKSDGTPYKVFTPFYQKGCLSYGKPRKPLPAPEKLQFASIDESSLQVEDLKLMPTINWYSTMENYWEIGEDGAQKRLKTFLQNGLKNYKEGRNLPANPNVSRLSPHLHFGEISPNQVWYAAKDYSNGVLGQDLTHFLSELGWREFSYNLLYHFPKLPRQNLQKKFDTFPWVNESNNLKAWQQGKTGIPIVDAGMRQLWQTGYMHNRLRMIVGSFLVKNLLTHWHYGEEWFWDCLVDADLANNSASWQWIAGSGADAAPYFRIFNPVTQGEKFDPEGAYTRQFLPELENLPNKYLFKPWEAPTSILKDSGIVLGKDYPRPIVDLKQSRQRALDAFSNL